MTDSLFGNLVAPFELFFYVMKENSLFVSILSFLNNSTLREGKIKLFSLFIHNKKSLTALSTFSRFSCFVGYQVWVKFNTCWWTLTYRENKKRKLSKKTFYFLNTWKCFKNSGKNLHGWGIPVTSTSLINCIKYFEIKWLPVFPDQTCIAGWFCRKLME